MTKKGAGGGRKREDLTGRQFGDLMVLSPAEKKREEPVGNVYAPAEKNVLFFPGILRRER